MKYNDIPQFVADYLNYKYVVQNRTELTIKNYYTDIKVFLRFLKQSRNLCNKNTDFNDIDVSDISVSVIKSVTLNDILEFLNYTKSERSNEAKARMRKAVSLRQFFKYLTNTKGYFDKSPCDNLELPTPKAALPKHLTVEQAMRLLSQASNISDWQDARDYCMITFFLNCGIRLSELVNINVNDYKETEENTDTVSFIKVLGKGRKERIVYLNNACVEAYKAYMNVRPDVPYEKALFLSRNNKRISNRRVEQIIDDKLKQSGLSDMGFSVHKLRHTAATLMYQNGVDVRVLKEVLGHENLNTTQIYTHVVNEQMKKAMNSNPLADVKNEKKSD